MDPRHAVAFDRTVGRWSYRVHRGLYRATGGVIGHRSRVGSFLLLTTVGRRTGERRTTPLLYMPDGDDFVVVASNGGRDRPPAWVLNLDAAPAAEVQVGRRKLPVTAEVLRGADKEPLWSRATGYYEGWNHYQGLTGRDIPVVRLRTRSPEVKAATTAG
ncbi:MAG TPA: nitroreductase/quinone reductase family protein [Acidimicrobiales bacterium]|nr:nitroreductase/quinone reductase family protein [Acidimicrobiales bacterium]